MEEEEAKIKLLKDLDGDIRCGDEVIVPKPQVGTTTRVPLYIADHLVDEGIAEWADKVPFVDVGDLTRLLREETQSAGLRNIPNYSLISALFHIKKLREQLTRKETKYGRMKHDRILNILNQIIENRIEKALKLASMGTQGITEKLSDGELEIIGKSLSQVDWWTKLPSKQSLPSWRNISKDPEEVID